MKSNDHLNFLRASVPQFRASRYIRRLNLTSVSKVMTIWNSRELLLFNFERLDMWGTYIGHPTEKLWPFEFSQSFCFQLRASRYTKGHNRTSESKVIVVWICSELLFSITSISIYYGTPSDIRVKICCRLIFLRATVFNFERLDILRDTIGHPSQKLLSFEFAQSFNFQLRASRYITGLNRTSE